MAYQGLFSSNRHLQNHTDYGDPEGPQQAEILDTDAEILAEILLEIRDPKSQAIFSVKYVNLYHVNCNVRHPASWHSSLPGELVVHCLSVIRGITMADSPAHITHGCRLKAAGE